MRVLADDWTFMVDVQRELKRISHAFEAVDRVLQRFAGRDPHVRMKSGNDPLTDVDLALDAAIRRAIGPESAEGWLSEETADDLTRLGKSRVWIVDPLDGTREFVAGIPEWSVAIGLVVDGVPVIGGVHVPPAGKTILGAVGHGVTVNGSPHSASTRADLAGAIILASRSEVERGEWKPFVDSPVEVRPMGSVALKAALVGAGEADATLSLQPKNEWDVAAACAIVLAGGGTCSSPNGSELVFNRRNHLFGGFMASGSSLHDHLVALTGALAPRSRSDDGAA